MIRYAIIVVLVLVFLYGLVKALPLLEGPTIMLVSPVDGQTFGDGEVSIRGVARYTDTLTLDGGPLLIDESGNFSTSLLLPHGNAILSLTATDRFGRSRTERRTILVP